MKQQLKTEILNRVKEDESLQVKIALFLNRKFRTVYRWVLDNDEMLTAPAVLHMIREHFGYSEDTQLTKSQRATAA